jgi:hypothetical protein
VELCSTSLGVGVMGKDLDFVIEMVIEGMMEKAEGGVRGV